jgi:hypothetical protein
MELMEMVFEINGKQYTVTAADPIEGLRLAHELAAADTE